MRIGVVVSIIIKYEYELPPSLYSSVTFGWVINKLNMQVSLVGVSIRKRNGYKLHAPCVLPSSGASHVWVCTFLLTRTFCSTHLPLSCGTSQGWVCTFLLTQTFCSPHLLLFCGTSQMHFPAHSKANYSGRRDSGHEEFM